MRRLVFVFILLIASPAAGTTYRWEDDHGTVFFTDDFQKIPEKYRGQAEKEPTPQRRKRSTPPETSRNNLTSKGLPLFEQKTDRMGHGKTWWRDLKKRWEKKKKKAEDQIARVELEMRQLHEHTMMPEERREQEERRMRKQMRAAQMQREVAVRMLTVGIPEEARNADAPLEWISGKP